MACGLDMPRSLGDGCRQKQSCTQPLGVGLETGPKHVMAQLLQVHSHAAHYSHSFHGCCQSCHISYFSPTGSRTHPLGLLEVQHVHDCVSSTTLELLCS
jgi:hypothetical protein